MADKNEPKSDNMKAAEQRAELDTQVTETDDGSTVLYQGRSVGPDDTHDGTGRAIDPDTDEPVDRAYEALGAYPPDKRPEDEDRVASEDKLPGIPPAPEQTKRDRAPAGFLALDRDDEAQ
jgi:hypothetical protein